MENSHSEDCRTGQQQCILHFKQEDGEISASRAVQLSNQSREEKLIKVSLLSPPLCQVRLSANPKRLLQREVQSLNIILVVVSVCLEQPSPAQHNTP